ncbi:MAG: hypothetical protein WC495_05560 [Patescibacteria group bacterium]|jgi:hypothetical protein
MAINITYIKRGFDMTPVNRQKTIARRKALELKVDDEINALVESLHDSCALCSNKIVVRESVIRFVFDMVNRESDTHLDAKQNVKAINAALKRYVKLYYLHGIKKHEVLK